MKNKKIKKFCIKLLKYMILFVMLLCIYIVALTISSLIPSSFLKKNVIESSEVLNKEGERKIINLGYKTETVFNFTDALMINIAYSINSEEPLTSALLARKNYIPGQTLNEHVDKQYDLGASKEYVNEKNGDIYQTKELYGLMHGENITDSFEYARYWHGYLVVLRPLLAITNYSGIRIISLAITILLVVTLLYKLYKKIDISTSTFFLIGLLAISIFYVTQGINEIIVYLIALAFSIILLCKKDINKSIGEIFFVIGSITSFTDLLTAPLSTLGIPLIVYILLLQKDEVKLKDIMINIIKVCVLWGFGYAFTWMMKWVITQIALGRPIISQAIEQAKYRTQLKSTKLNYFSVLLRNLAFLSNATLIGCAIILIIFTIFKLIINKNKRINFKQNIKLIIPYVITAIMPFAWYLVLQEHSYIHAFFTYRILIITIISMFIIVNKICKVEEESCEEKK